MEKDSSVHNDEMFVRVVYDYEQVGDNAAGVFGYGRYDVLFLIFFHEVPKLEGEPYDASNVKEYPAVEDREQALCWSNNDADQIGSE